MRLENWTELGDGPRAWVRRVGQALGRAAQPGDVLALSGDLGAGKTFFTRAIAQGLQIDHPREVCSPTFAVLQHHTGKVPLHHADLYRIETLRELEDIGLLSLSATGLLVVEWPERVPEVFPAETLWLRLERVRPLRRKVKVSGQSVRAQALIEVLRQVPTARTDNTRA